MATYSAVMSGDDRYTLYLDITESNVSITNNTSVVNYALRLVFSQPLIYGAWSSIGKYSLTINGVALASNVTFSYDFRNYSSKTLASGSLTVAHNADGSKTVGCSGYAWMDDGKGSASPSGNFVLTTIARASQPTLNTSSQALGSQIRIYTNKAAAFTHTFVYTFGNESNTIETGVVDYYDWILPSSLANQIPNATSGTGTITCTTYNGSTNIGSKTVNFTATVPNNTTYQPSIPSISLVPANQYDSKYIKTKSSLTVNSSSTGYFGASISSYKVTVNGQTLYGASVASGILMTAGTNTVGVTVVDSRGFSRYNSTTFSVSDYFTPNISAFTAVRSSPNTTVNIGVTYTIASGIPSSSTVQWSAAGVNDWSNSIKSWSNVNVNESFTTSVYSADSSYDFKLTVNDHYTSVSKIVTISTGFSLMNFRYTGKGLAIGQVSTADIFQVGITAEFNGTARFNVGTYVPDARNMPGTNTLATYVPIPTNVPDYSLTTLFSSGLGNASDWKSGILVKGWEGPTYAVWSLSGPASTTAHDDFYLQSGVGSTWRPAQKIWHSGNLNSSNINAAQLSSMSASYAATGNTIASRAAGGYLQATYFNQTSGQETIAASSYFYETTSNDGYLRKKPLAAVKTEIVTKAAIEAALTGLISSHSHNTLTYTNISDQNVNIARPTGFYQGYNMANAKTSGWHYYIYQYHDPNHCVIICIPLDYSGLVWWKRLGGGIWTGWNQINL